MKGFAGFCHNKMERDKNMKKSDEKAVIRKYLLGNLSDEIKRREIEKRSLADDSFDEELSIAEDELIEDYLDEALSADERERFTRFFLLSRQRREKLELIQNLRKYARKSVPQPAVQPSEEKKRFFGWQRLFSSPAFRFAVLALFVFALGFVVWRVGFYQSDVERGLAQLQAAYRGQRPIESRSTANFEYAPHIVTRGDEGAIADTKARDRAERLLLDATEDTANAKAHHALGLFYLAEKKFDKAINEFNLALKIAPDKAKLHSDMGAAYLEKAKVAEQEEKGEEFFANSDAALKYLNQALELNENIPEALFNKALILQKMRLPNEAQKAWRQYLEIDSVSPWADEARENLEELKKQIQPPKDKTQILQDFLDAFQQGNDARAWAIISQTKEMVTGVMIQQQLVRKFLEANQQSRKEEADKILSAFVYLGELEKKYAEDHYFSELAAFYVRSSKWQQQKLITAYAELQKGNELIPKTDFQTALETFKRARALFISSESDWEARLVEHRVGYCLTQLKRIKESNEILNDLSNFSESRNYKWMQALADNWVASNFSILGEHSKAINYNRKSLKTAEQISDIYNIQKSATQMANEYWLIGDSGKTFATLYRSINFSGLYYQSPRQKSRNLLFVTEGLYRFKFFDAAAAFGSEEIFVAQEELKDKWLSHTAFMHSALIYGQKQKYEEAFQAIESSFQAANSFEDKESRKQQVSYSRLILAHLQREAGKCMEAVANYNQVIRDYENSDFSINKYEARKGRLLCYVGLKNNTAIQEEITAVFQMFDENRQKIVEETDRNIFFDNEQSVYDIAADYSYTHLQDSEQAFNFTENSRARSLLNLVENNSSKPLVLSEIRQKISPQVQILYYAVLDDKLLLWQITNSKSVSAAKLIKAEELDEKVQNYTKLIADKNHNPEAAKELYQILIQPVEPELEKDKVLCIIADKMLFRLPFASLVSPANKYLVEDYALFYAPSASLLINKTKIAERKTQGQKETILAVGNPSFSSEDYPELVNLSKAANEAETVASLYDSKQVLLAHSAAKKPFLDNLDKADIVHFAGHYIPNRQSPSSSKLLLAGGDLTINEIGQNRLSRPRLMILSACETGVEKFYKGEGMIGAARAFLASSIPLVIASQWAVDSNATAELMVKFHQHRRLQNHSTIKALQHAQADILKGENNRMRQPFYWAGFLPVGGYAVY